MQSHISAGLAFFHKCLWLYHAPSFLIILYCPALCVGRWCHCNLHHGAEISVTCAGVQAPIWAGHGGKCLYLCLLSTLILHCINTELCNAGGWVLQRAHSESSHWITHLACDWLAGWKCYCWRQTVVLTVYLMFPHWHSHLQLPAHVGCLLAAQSMWVLVTCTNVSDFW